MHLHLQLLVPGVLFPHLFPWPVLSYYSDIRLNVTFSEMPSLSPKLKKQPVTSNHVSLCNSPECLPLPNASLVYLCWSTCCLTLPHHAAPPQSMLMRAGKLLIWLTTTFQLPVLCLQSRWPQHTAPNMYSWIVRVMSCSCFLLNLSTPFPPLPLPPLSPVLHPLHPDITSFRIHAQVTSVNIPLAKSTPCP